MDTKGEDRPPGSDNELSHVERDGDQTRSRMVDVGQKEPSARSALARALVVFPPGLLEGVMADGGPKGPVTEVARAAGILGAKRTGDLIPMCHPLALDWVQIEFRALDGVRLEVLCRASCTGRTGVEMESLVGASIASLTVYDMTKALSKEIRLESVELIEKTGGKSGVWRREGTG